MKNPIKLFRLGLADEFFKSLAGKKTKPPKAGDFGEEILMPGQNGPLHNGFVNCAHNTNGLQAKFYRASDDRIGMRWENQLSGFEGYPGIIHGGITASLLDEIMSTALFHKTGKFGVTVKARLEWKKTLKTGDLVTGLGEAVYATTDFARVKAHIFRGDGKLVASADGTFYFPTEKQFQQLVGIEAVPSDLVQFFRK